MLLDLSSLHLVMIVVLLELLDVVGVVGSLAPALLESACVEQLLLGCHLLWLLTFWLLLHGMVLCGRHLDLVVLVRLDRRLWRDLELQSTALVSVDWSFDIMLVLW